MRRIEADRRNEEALRRHFDIERGLADRLRAAGAAERKSLYRTVYNELFERVPDHPQNTRKSDPARQQEATERQLRLLGRFLGPQSVYLEVGAGDCHLALAVARRARHVYAIDVSDVIANGTARPANFNLVVSDGTSIDVPAGSVDVAYSNQLMEHMHPEDAAEQLRAIHASLAPGGRYVCITPHRFSGPHDVSGCFGTEARGFHLKEYTFTELSRLFRNVGFSSVEAWTGARGWFFRVPAWLVRVAEAALGALPAQLRRSIMRAPVVRPLFANLAAVGSRQK